MEEKQKGLKGYNLRKDYGEIDTSANIINDNKVIRRSEKDNVYLAGIAIVIERRGKKSISRQKFFKEYIYKDGQELDKNSYLYSMIKRDLKIKDLDIIKIVSINKLKIIGLI